MSGSDATGSYLVECYWPGVSSEAVAAAAARVRGAASALGSDGAEVTFLGSILVPADETVFCLFDGREEDVRAVTIQAALPFERVLASLRIDGNPAKEGNGKSCFDTTGWSESPSR
jgi:hypothetical protein